MQYFSSPFPLPAHRIVGLLTCQIEPFAKTLETRVVSCDKSQVSLSLAGSKETNQSKKAAKAKSGQKQENAEEWEIELEDTVLFPEGGGQPWDHGMLRAGDQSVPVQRIVRKGVQAVHMASSPLSPGTPVSIELDWTRRLDLMQQHSGQHLLSGVLEEVYKIPTLGWSLQPFPQPSYIELSRAPTAEEIQSTIEMCNKAIRDNSPVTVHVALEGEQERPDTMPDDYHGGVVRHVKIHAECIPNDWNACCGTHVPTLGHLQALHVLPNTTPIRTTNVRLYFLVGSRVLDNLANTLEATRLTALAHGCHQADVVHRTEGAVAALRETQKALRRAKEEVAGFLAKELIEQAKGSGGKAVLVRDGEELESLSFLGTRLKDTAPPEYTFVLASNLSTGGCPVLVLGHDVNAVADRLKAAFEGKLRGGGKGRWQGKFEGKLNKKENAVLREAVFRE